MATPVSRLHCLFSRATQLLTSPPQLLLPRTRPLARQCSIRSSCFATLSTRPARFLRPSQDHSRPRGMVPTRRWSREGGGHKHEVDLALAFSAPSCTAQRCQDKGVSKKVRRWWRCRLCPARPWLPRQSGGVLSRLQGSWRWPMDGTSLAPRANVQQQLASLPPLLHPSVWPRLLHNLASARASEHGKEMVARRTLAARAWSRCEHVLQTFSCRRDSDVCGHLNAWGGFCKKSGKPSVVGKSLRRHGGRESSVVEGGCCVPFTVQHNYSHSNPPNPFSKTTNSWRSSTAQRRARVACRISGT